MESKSVNVSSLCRRAGISRQGYHKQTKHRQRRALAEGSILNIIRECRQKHTKMGTRKLLVKIVAQGHSIGRDRLFALLRFKNLLILRRKRFHVTTDSKHGFRTYSNLLQDLTVTGPHQGWASDITYIRTKEGFLYLALITDVGSRKIVGYCVNDTLEAEGCMKALKMAIRQLPAGASPLHHSDRGSQYCCHAYIKILKKRKLWVSMTEQNHCYENALAERVNGILKHEYLLKYCFPTKQMARLACSQAIELYNEDRPHMALDMQTPQQAHMMVSTQLRA
jgi:putative transposase